MTGDYGTVVATSPALLVQFKGAGAGVPVSDGGRVVTVGDRVAVIRLSPGDPGFVAAVL